MARKALAVGPLTVTWLVIGVGLLAGSSVSLYFPIRNEALAVYNSAPACSTIADALAGNDCRFTTTATVTDIVGVNETDSIDLVIAGSNSPLLARVPTSDSEPRVGDQVQVELWRSTVTRLGGAATADNPANDPRLETLLVIGLILLALGAGVTGWGILRARRHAQGGTAGLGMSPVAMSDVLWR